LHHNLDSIAQVIHLLAVQVFAFIIPLDRRPISLCARACLEELQTAISQQQIIWCTSGLVLGWSNRERSI